MLTRRSFLGTVAAVAMSPLASKAVPAERFRFVRMFGGVPPLEPVKFSPLAADDDGVMWYEHWVQRPGDFIFDRAPRRDDGDTILELR